MGIDLSKVYSTNTIRSWSVPSNEWIEWVNRLAKVKSANWSESGILHAILISQFKIPLDQSLFYSALMFWAPSFNTFIFKCGPIGPTIADVSALLRLLPHGDYFRPEYSPDSEFMHLEVEVKGTAKARKIKHISAYKTWLLHFRGQGEVTDDEHVAFLVYRLNKFIFCNSSVAITK